MSDKLSKQRLSRRAFLQASAATTVGLVVVACAPPAAAPQSSGGNAAPAAGKAKIAKNDFEAKYEEVGQGWAGVTLRLPIGHEGHWVVNEEASKRFTELTGIKTVWENNPYDQVYDKSFLDVGSQSGTYDVLDLNFAWLD